MANFLQIPVLIPPETIKKNLSTRLPEIIIGSLTLVAALAWNDAFQSLINYYVPEKYKGKSNVWVKLLYSLALTIVIIIVISVILYTVDKKMSIRHDGR